MKVRIRIFILLISILLIGITWALYHLSIQKNNLDKELKEYCAKDFEFYNSPMDSRMKVFILFSTKCQLCELDAKRLQKIHTKYPNISFTWLSTEDSITIHSFKDKLNFNSRNVCFGRIKSEIAVDKYQLDSPPAFIIYKDFELFEIQNGILNESTLEELIQNS